MDYCKENGIVFYAYMVLEQGALSGNYDTAHPFPADSDRGKTYNPMLGSIEKLTEVLKKIGKAHEISPAQTAIAWAITKNTLPIVGVTKVHHVEDAAKAAWNDDGWIMEALKVHYKTLVRYLNFKDQGMVLGVGCKTPSMTKKSKFLQAAYNLGKSI